MKEKNAKSVKKTIFVGPSFKRFLMLMCYTTVAIVFLALCNLGFGFMTKKFNMKIDLTPNSLYSISDKTKEYLKNYDRKLRFIIWDGGYYDFIGRNRSGESSYAYGRISSEQEAFVEFINSVVSSNPNFEVECLNVANEAEKMRKNQDGNEDDLDEFSGMKTSKIPERFKDVKMMDDNDRFGRFPMAGVVVIDETEPENKKGFSFKRPEYVEDDYMELDQAIEKVKVKKKPMMEEPSSKKIILNFEKGLIGKLEKLSGKNTIKVASSSGHGEYDFSLNTDFFEQMGVVLEKVDLTKKEVSNDFDVLLIAAPTNDFTSEELNKIDNFLKGGKGVIYCASAMQQKVTDLEEFLKVRGIVFSEGLLVNLKEKELGALVRLNLEGQKNVYTEKMHDQKYPLLISRCKPMRLENGQDGWKVSEICKTSPDYGLVTGNVKSLEGLPKSEYVIAAMSQKELEPQKQAKLIALSGVDFAHGIFSQPQQMGFGRMQQESGIVDKLLLSNSDFASMLFKEASGKDVATCGSFKTIEQTPDFVIYSENGDHKEIEKISRIRTIIMLIIPGIFLLAGFVVLILRKRRK